MDLLHRNLKAIKRKWGDPVPLSSYLADFCTGHAAHLVVAMDILVLPAMLCIKWLSAIMLSTDKPCAWTEIGLRCGTCGGTHCVNAFATGKWGEALAWNPFVFVCICYALFSALLLNAAVFAKSSFAAKSLRSMYSLTMFFVALGVYISFIVVRNICGV